MTTRTRSLPRLLLTAAVALAAVGCGVEVNDDLGSGPSDTIAVPEAPTPETEPDAPTTTEADGGDDETTTTEPDDDATTTEPEGEDTTVPSLPPGLDEDAIAEQLATSFESLGLTATESECLADAYLREFGATTASPDYSKMFDLFAECDIDPTAIGG